MGASLAAGEQLSYRFSDASRFGYLVPAKGKVSVNDLELKARDGAAIHQEELITVVALEDAELVLVDTAGPRP